MGVEGGDIRVQTPGRFVGPSAVELEKLKAVIPVLYLEKHGTTSRPALREPSV